MTIHCTYNADSNGLLDVSDVFNEPTAGQLVRSLDRDMPDFSVEEWNPAILQFQTKIGVAVSKREFIKRLSVAEYAAIKAAASANAAVDYYWQMFMTSEAIVLSHPDTVAGINTLEQIGLLAPGRAAEILA